MITLTDPSFESKYALLIVQERMTWRGGGGGREWITMDVQQNRLFPYERNEKYKNKFVNVYVSVYIYTGIYRCLCKYMSYVFVIRTTTVRYIIRCLYEK